MTLPMLSDTTLSISKAYGCNSDEGVSLRATYIIDTKGIVRHLSINDLPVGRNVSEYLRLVQAFQHADKFGEVCPASWVPGAKTMKPSHEEEMT